MRESIFWQVSAYCPGMLIGQKTVGIQIIEITRSFLDRYIHRRLIGQRSVSKVFRNNLSRKIAEQAGIGQYKKAVIPVGHDLFEPDIFPFRR
ncbi:hypothetical protein SDC9_206498 [bioreactor metagenome]|uniref:Uncharacterized protein n=1 Tax=bioreactor metagenome TaxID=1076179 RepID=A0A645JEG8_9ZZZZ